MNEHESLDIKLSSADFLKDKTSVRVGFFYVLVIVCLGFTATTIWKIANENAYFFERESAVSHSIFDGVRHLITLENAIARGDVSPQKAFEATERMLTLLEGKMGKLSQEDASAVASFRLYMKEIKEGREVFDVRQFELHLIPLRTSLYHLIEKIYETAEEIDKKLEHNAAQLVYLLGGMSIIYLLIFIHVAFQMRKEVVARTQLKRFALLIKEAQDKTAQALHRAESANFEKSRFLANMSHEIRTPINGILGLIKLMDETELSEGQKHQLRIIESSTESLLVILNDILDFSKIESGQLSIENIEFDLHETIMQVAELMKGRIKEKGLKFYVHIHPDVPKTFKSDPNRLRQIVMNFLSNAVKFTDKGKIELNIFSRALDNSFFEIFVEIEDTGIGISDENKERIFQRFSQEDTTITRRFGGTGLGLAICKSIAEMMGGKVGFLSEKGRGSKFWVQLMGEGKMEAPAAKAAQKREGLIKLKKLEVLVAEDNKVNQLIVKTFLEKEGHQITVVENGQEALDACHQKRFDMILMDIQMPVMDGLTAIQKIRAGEIAQRNIPIVVLTANALSGDREKFLTGGADGYVSKPISFDLLLEEMQNVLATH